MVKGMRAVTLDSLIESVLQGPAVIMYSRWPLHLATSSVTLCGFWQPVDQRCDMR